MISYAFLIFPDHILYWARTQSTTTTSWKSHPNQSSSSGKTNGRRGFDGSSNRLLLVTKNRIRAKSLFVRTFREFTYKSTGFKMENFLKDKTNFVFL